MKKRVTLYDIASELNISASTVSRVLNGSALISDDTSRLIRETAEKLGYVQRTVKKQKNRAILDLHLFLPPSKESFVHLFYDVAQLLEGIKEGFGEVSINISTRVNDGDISFLNKKKTGTIDGCLFAFTTVGRKLKNELETRGIPYVHLNRKIGDSYIYYDNGKAMEKLVNSLHRKYGEELRPCYLGFTPLSTVDDERWTGVKKACHERGIPLDDKARISLESIDTLNSHMDELLSRGYNSVIAFNDMIALAFLHRAQKRGVSIPDGISLTGVDNSPVQLIMTSKIDTIEFSVSLLGKEAGKWLYERIIEKNESPCQIVLEGEYIKGDTL